MTRLCIQIQGTDNFTVTVQRGTVWTTIVLSEGKIVQIAAVQACPYFALGNRRRVVPHFTVAKLNRKAIKATIAHTHLPGSRSY